MNILPSLYYETSFLDYNVSIRQDILKQTIGPLSEETEAYNKIWNISVYFPLALTGVTIIQFLAYLCYNRWFHPFKVLVKTHKPEAKTDPATLELQAVEMNNCEIPEDQNDQDKPVPTNEKMN